MPIVRRAFLAAPLALLGAASTAAAQPRRGARAPAADREAAAIEDLNAQSLDRARQGQNAPMAAAGAAAPPEAEQPPPRRRARARTTPR